MTRSTTSTPTHTRRLLTALAAAPVLFALPALADPDPQTPATVEGGDRIELTPRAGKDRTPASAVAHPYLAQLSRDLEGVLKDDDPLAGQRLRGVALTGTRDAPLKPLAGRATAWAIGDVLSQTFQEAGLMFSATRLKNIDTPSSAADLEDIKLTLEGVRRDLRTHAVSPAGDGLTTKRRRQLERALVKADALVALTERVYRGDVLRPASAHANAVTAVLAACRAAGLPAATGLTLARSGLAATARASGG